MVARQTGSGLVLALTASQPFSLNAVRGSQNPLGGWWSERLESVAPSCLVMLDVHAVGVLEIAALLVPFESESVPDSELKLEVNVDENDVARRLSVEADFTVPEGTGDGEIKGGSLSFAYILEEVGIDPQIEAPANAKPLSELTQQFAPLLGGGLGQPTP